MLWNPLMWPRWAQGAAILVLAAIAIGLWFRAHDQGVIEKHETGITEKIGTATDAAFSVANTRDAERRENDARVDESLRKAIQDAEAKHPVEVRHDAGPATRATLERLRQRAPASGSAAH